MTRTYAHATMHSAGLCSSLPPLLPPSTGLCEHLTVNEVSEPLIRHDSTRTALLCAHITSKNGKVCSSCHH